MKRKRQTLTMKHMNPKDIHAWVLRLPPKYRHGLFDAVEQAYSRGWVDGAEARRISDGFHRNKVFHEANAKKARL